MRLNTLKECGALVDHKFIPSDEIFVKFGGDHGGGSFKSTYQIANVLHPNKVENTVIFSIFTQKDSRANLRICLQRFKAQISKLQSVKWVDGEKEKSIRVFMYGDYEYLCSMYGISGASGKYPCIFCLISNQDMQKPKSDLITCTPRTLEHFKNMYKKFTNDYNSNLKYAMNCFNVINELFFDVPLDQVCLPGLHITLGIFMKLFREVLEKYCREMDARILNHNIVSRDDINFNDENYVNYVHLIRQRADLMYEKDDLMAVKIDLEEQLEWLAVAQSEADEAVYQEEISAAQSRIDEIEMEVSEIDKQVKEDDVIGPCEKKLDCLLKEIGVERQAYYGNTIVGNHCHLLLKESSIKKLSNVVKDTVLVELGEGLEYREADAKGEKISEVFTYYSKCHKVLNSADYVDDSCIIKFCDDVSIFMKYLRFNWPEINISPKLHLLEYHAADFLKRWNSGCGFFGEQGAESAHNGINRMKDRYKCVRNDKDQLIYIMNQHLLSTNPKAQNVKPKQKTRTKKAV